ncbi:hypothetical protein TPMD03_3 [Thiohalocapsa phage LS06-2018-MD03]|nr:hypothetical protein TPMD03_3 [Thiohalocapsa phage LS06-2018-MD03]
MFDYMLMLQIISIPLVAINGYLLYKLWNIGG